MRDLNSIITRLKLARAQAHPHTRRQQIDAVLVDLEALAPVVEAAIEWGAVDREWSLPGMGPREALYDRFRASGNKLRAALQAFIGAAPVPSQSPPEGL